VNSTKRSSLVLSPTWRETLYQAERPARYVGGERNAYRKEEAGLLRVALAYPDLYEIGMSNLGLSILYHIINAEPDLSCERVYAPAPDLEALLRRNGGSLCTLESGRPLGELDILGFSLQYEMTYPQVLNMLDLGGIPLRTTQRGPTDPVVIAGGPCAANPEPMAHFFDAILVGDGEEALLEICRLVQSWKREEGRTRDELLLALSRIPGLYVPSLYCFHFSPDGTIEAIEPHPHAPTGVVSRRVRDLETSFFPTRPIVPTLETVHDRAQVELFRGCLRGCRFCQAGFIYRPRRMRSAGLLKRQAEEIIATTGWEELGLVSLSSCDYPHLEELLQSLGPLRAEQRVNISLPSLRADSFSVEVARLAQGHQITLTFAPEAGSDRLRQAIGKQLLEEEILTAAEQAARCRFPRIKLYFMIGLPTEREEDMDGILALVEKLRRRAKSAGGGVKFSAAVSAFVPKPQTPFQWEPMERLEGIRAKRSFLRDRFRRMGVEAGGQQEELSILEGVLARGDRRVGEAVFFAWQEGARLDGWSDHFSFARWQSALARSGLEPSFYLHRTRPQEEILPWSLVRFAAGPAYLWRERERAYSDPLPSNPCPQTSILNGSEGKE